VTKGRRDKNQICDVTPSRKSTRLSRYCLCLEYCNRLRVTWWPGTKTQWDPDWWYFGQASIIGLLYWQLQWEEGRNGNKLRCISEQRCASCCINPLTPNDPYRGRTAPLTSKRFILYIYSINTGTEYFKRGIYCPFLFSSLCSLFHNSNLFGSCFIHILYTKCAKIKKKKFRHQKVKRTREFRCAAFRNEWNSH